MSEPDDSPNGAAEVVDFDALNAALGALPPPPTSSSPAVGESEGRSSATYSSARPHTIPPSYAPNEDPNAPAVIVAADETIPTGPPQQMTVPMGHGVNVVAAPHPAAPRPPDAVRPPMPSSPGQPFTPQPFPPAGAAVDKPVNVTVPLAGAPPVRRRPRTPTIVVRPSGPTKSQKLIVFLAMLVVFVAGGLAFLVLYRPRGIKVESLLPTATTSPAARSAAMPASAAAAAPATPPATSNVVDPSSGLAVPASSTSGSASTVGSGTPVGALPTSAIPASALPSSVVVPKKPRVQRPAAPPQP